MPCRCLAASSSASQSQQKHEHGSSRPTGTRVRSGPLGRPSAPDTDADGPKNTGRAATDTAWPTCADTCRQPSRRDSDATALVLLRAHCSFVGLVSQAWVPGRLRWRSERAPVRFSLRVSHISSCHKPSLQIDAGAGNGHARRRCDTSGWGQAKSWLGTRMAALPDLSNHHRRRPPPQPYATARRCHNRQVDGSVITCASSPRARGVSVNTNTFQENLSTNRSRNTATTSYCNAEIISYCYYVYPWPGSYRSVQRVSTAGMLKGKYLALQASTPGQMLLLPTGMGWERVTVT